MADRIGLAPGKYELIDTVQNPKPDRRQRHDWRYEVEWKKGTQFYVVEHTSEPDGLQVKWSTVFKRGEYEHNAIGLRGPTDLDDYDGFKALKLVEKLAPVTEKRLGDVFHGPCSIEPHIDEGRASELIAIMLEKGFITFEQVEQVVSDLNNQSEEQWLDFRKKHGI